MKKRLAKVIMMGLACYSIIPNICFARAISSSTDLFGGALSYDGEAAIEIIDGPHNEEIHISLINGAGFTIQAKNASEIINNSTKKVFINGSSIFLSGDNDINRKCVSLVNYGKLNINNLINIVNNGTGIANYGELTINNKLEFYCNDEIDASKNNGFSNIKTAIINHIGANLNMNQVQINSLVADYNTNTGSSIDLYPGGIAIDNFGKLNIDRFDYNNNYETTIIEGDIIARTGSELNINLEGQIGEMASLSDYFEGAIIVEDGAQLNLRMGNNAVWGVPNRQKDVLSGVEINHGIVELGIERCRKYSGTYYNANDWCNLKLSNLKSVVGNGYFYVNTDLRKDVGDRLDIISLEENTKTFDARIYIRDAFDEVNVDKKYIPSPQEGHSVTIATSPVGSGVIVNANGRTYQNDNKCYEVVVNKEVINGWNHWNFVGWEATGEDKRDNNKAPKEAIEYSILVEDIDPIFKRFNDLRTDPSEIGVWVRGETGETKIRNLSYDHNIMSGGYDWDYKNDAGVLFAGVGFTYSTNECDDKAIGDTKGYGFNAYGSWLGKKNNDYVDLVVKYGKLDKSYAGYDENNIFVAGEYDKDLFTIAAKYGRRIFKDDWYYEPSVGLTWGRVGSADFTDNHGTRIHADNSYSNIASLGIQVGKNIKGIEYYGKAEVMHDFDGKIHVSAPGRSVEDDIGGTWVKCAIGASRKIDENNSFYLEVERDFGNKVEKPYGFSAGYRFTW